MLTRERPEENHGVEINVRIEEREGETGAERRTEGGADRRIGGQTLRPQGTPHGTKAIDNQKQRPAIARHGQDGGCGLDQGAKPRNTCDDQERIGERTDEHDRQHVFPPDPLPQDKRVLRSNCDDEGSPRQESSEEIGADQ